MVAQPLEFSFYHAWIGDIPEFVLYTIFDKLFVSLLRAAALPGWLA